MRIVAIVVISVWRGFVGGFNLCLWHLTGMGYDYGMLMGMSMSMLVIMISRMIDLIDSVLCTQLTISSLVSCLMSRLSFRRLLTV